MGWSPKQYDGGAAERWRSCCAGRGITPVHPRDQIRARMLARQDRLLRRVAPVTLDAPAAGTTRDDIRARMFARQERIRKTSLCGERSPTPRAAEARATSSKPCGGKWGSRTRAWDGASTEDSPPSSSRPPAKTPMQVYAGLARKRFMALQAERQEEQVRRSLSTQTFANVLPEPAAIM